MRILPASAERPPARGSRWAVALLALCTVSFGSGCVANLDLGDAETDRGTGGQTGGEATSGGAGGSSTATPGESSGTAELLLPLDAREFAITRCNTVRGCGCIRPDDRWSDGDLCIEDITTAWQDRFDAAASIGAEVNVACWNAQVAMFADPNECTNAPPIPHRTVVDTFFCDAFVGNDGVGEPCSVASGGIIPPSTCQAGLVCHTGVCVERPQEGEACLEPRAEGGFFSSPCASPLACTDGVCGAPPALGEPCPVGLCADEGVCKAQDGGVAICTAPLGTGESCESAFECSSHRCRGGECELSAAAACGPYFEELSE